MEDETVYSIRQVRHAISVEFDHDPEKLVSYYLNYQEKYRDRLAVFSRKLSRVDIEISVHPKNSKKTMKKNDCIVDASSQ